MAAATVTETALRQHVSAWLDASSRRARTLLVRAQPRWTGEPVILVGNTRVHVIEGVSGLAVLDAMRTTPPDDAVVALTLLDERQLGSAVVLDAHPQRVTNLDEWSVVPELFAARDSNTSRHVHGLGRWVPGMLIELRPERGYPSAPGGVLTAEHVMRSLMMALLGLSRIEDLDLATALTPLDDPGVRARLRALPADVQEMFVRAASDDLGADLALALRATLHAGHVSTIAIGLVAGELWATRNVDADTAAARVRIERYLGSQVSAAAALRFGEVSRRVIGRLLADDHGRELLEQADALCAELEWSAGVRQSDILLSGLHARIRRMQQQITEAVASPTRAHAVTVDRAFADIARHQAASTVPSLVPAAAMAMRLVRWLSGATPVPANISDAIASYMRDGAWVERALGDVWDGAPTPELASAFRQLAHSIRDAQAAGDAAASSLLQQAAGAHAPKGVIRVEDLLTQVIVPLSAQHRVLLIVLDGMSAATAIELAADLPRRGWTELVPAESRQRIAAVATLPTITEYSRTSLFAGRLLAGNQQTEKSRFSASVGGVVFHKDDLRADAGHALPSTVRHAIASVDRKIVGVVLNTIDDALATAEVDALRWKMDTIAHLAGLLDAAQDAGRLVILTSDHGHIVERGSELRAAAGAAARFRDPSTGPAKDDEVLVSGPRVLTPSGSAVLAVSDRLRFAGKKAGYHGGGALAELTVPIIVAKPSGASDPSGWAEAPPQEPVWWNEPTREVAIQDSVPQLRKTRTRKRPTQSAAEAALFEHVPEDEPATAVSVADLLLASDVYRDRRSAGGRHALSDAVLRAVIRALVDGGGRAHRDTIAAAAGVASSSLSGVLASLRRLLNVEGYAIIEVDPDHVTVTLNEKLLREQFGIRSQ
ncbi:BREX-2 system phosphatase PglZ [Microbacterium kribbense]|uniref:BREX-2 system phosphatase PglZ n=1 Tax=Microbacterium kribbense TaxID=433645 RepID=A0ABP7G255_9MICO